MRKNFVFLRSRTSWLNSPKGMYRLLNIQCQRRFFSATFFECNLLNLQTTRTHFLPFAKSKTHQHFSTADTLFPSLSLNSCWKSKSCNRLKINQVLNPFGSDHLWLQQDILVPEIFSEPAIHPCTLTLKSDESWNWKLRRKKMNCFFAH